MCYICSCLSSILDAVQRVVTFGLACWMCFVLCLGMIVASVAGIAYGYNYCMAEFLTLTSRSEVTVFMRRGKFYDPPDIKAPLVNPSGRRSGAFEEELNANMSSDYDESLRRTQEAASKSLGETWVKSDDTRRYAERLTKFSDNVDSNDVIMLSVHVTPSTTLADSRRANADGSGKYSYTVLSYGGRIKGDNDAERPKTTLNSTTLGKRYGNQGESTWKFPELLYKVDEDKAAMKANAPTYSTTLDVRKYGDHNNVDKTWDYAEQFSKYAGEEKSGMENTPLPFGKPTRTPGLSEFDKLKVELAASRSPGYLNFLKPLRTTDSRETISTDESNNYTKGRMSQRRTTQKGSDSKIKFVERKHQDSKATPAPMRHWAIRKPAKPSSSEEYTSSEEEDEDIVYKSV